MSDCNEYVFVSVLMAIVMMYLLLLWVEKSAQKIPDVNKLLQLNAHYAAGAGEDDEQHMDGGLGGQLESGYTVYAD